MLATAILIPIGVLAWLGAKILQQDLPLLYQPPQFLSPPAEDTSRVFALAEIEEFKNANLEAATTAYQKFAGSSLPAAAVPE